VRETIVKAEQLAYSDVSSHSPRRGLARELSIGRCRVSKIYWPVRLSVICLVAVGLFAVVALRGGPPTVLGRSGAPDQATRPTSTLPNLVAVSSAWLEAGAGDMRSCVSPSGPPGGLRICVVNRGGAAAGPFALAADGSPADVLARGPGLRPDEEVCLLVGRPVGQGIVVDALGEVAESREGDNWYPPLVPPTVEPLPTCEPTATPLPGTPAPTAGPLPDLAGYGWILMDQSPWGCLRAGDPQVWISQLVVANDGNAPAGGFRVALEQGDATLWTVSELPAGALMRRRGGNMGGGMLLVDADDAVREQDETNNRYGIPVPTQAPTCTPGPSLTPAPQPELVLERAEYSALGFDESCVRGLPIVRLHVRVANRGTGMAEGVLVEADGYRAGWSIRRLLPGQTTDLQPVDSPVHWVRIRPVPGETQEDNARSVPQITLTPPVTCSPVITSTDTPAATKTPNAHRGLWLPWLVRS
jgi:hypothetical protein